MFGLGIFVLIKNPNHQANGLFFALAIVITLEAFAEFQMRQAPTIELATMWMRFGSFWPLLIAIQAHFIILFIEKGTRFRMDFYFLVYTSAIIFTILGLTTDLLIRDPNLSEWGWMYTVPQAPFAYYIASAWAISISIGSILLGLYDYLCQRDDRKRQQLKYVLFGLSPPVVMGMITQGILPALNIPFPELTLPIYAISSFIIGVAISKHHLFVLTPTVVAETILTTLNDFLFLINPEGIIQQVNHSVLNHLGYEKHEIIGHPLTNVVGMNQPKNNILDEIHQAALNNPPSTPEVETSLKSKSGKIIPISISASIIQDNTGSPKGFVCLAQDITDRQQAEFALKTAEQEKRTILNSLSEVIVYYDPQMRIIWANQNALDAMGYELDKLVGQVCYRILHQREEPCAHCPVAKALKNRQQQQTEFKFDSGETWFIRGYPVYDSNGELTGVVEISVDISDRKKAELAHRDLEERRSEFITITSHELRTPLTSIRGYSELLEQRWEKLPQESIAQCFTAIRRNVQRLERLINGVSMLGQFERGEFRLERKEIDFHPFLMEALQPYLTFLGPQLEFHSCPIEHPVIIKGDPDRLLQVFDNLLENAIRHSDPQSRKIVVTFEVLSERVRVFVMDNGVGIAPENLERIFEQFVSIPTPYAAQGTGIGLFITKMIVKAHHGTVVAQSEGISRGSTFIVELPQKEFSITLE